MAINTFADLRGAVYQLSRAHSASARWKVARCLASVGDELGTSGEGRLVACEEDDEISDLAGFGHPRDSDMAYVSSRSRGPASCGRVRNRPGAARLRAQRSWGANGEGTGWAR